MSAKSDPNRRDRNARSVKRPSRRLGMLEQLERRELLSGPGDAFDGLAYANTGDGNVAVIDTMSRTVVETVPVADPGSVGVTPDGGRLYVSSCPNNNVTVIDATNRQVVGTIAVDDCPRSVAVSPLGDRVFVPNHNSGTVSVIGTDTNTVVGSIAVGSAPEDFIFAPGGMQAYVSNTLSQNVSVIDIASLSVTDTIGGLCCGPRSMALSPDGYRLYVATDWNGVYVVDTAARSVIANIPARGVGHHVAMTPDGSKLFVAHHSEGQIAVVDPATNTVTAITSVGERLGIIDVDPGGSLLYVPNNTSDDMTLIDTATNQVVGTIAIGSSTGSVAFGPAADEPPIADDQGVLLDEDTEAQITLTGTDQEGNDVSLRLVNLPQHGTLDEFDPATGGVTYTPDLNWHGLDQFTFVAIDPEGLESDPATVYVRVDPANDEPVFTPPAEQPIEVPKDVATSLDLCEWVRDVETPCQEVLFEASASVGAIEWLDNHSVRFLPEVGYRGPVELEVTVEDTGDVPGADADGDGVEDCDVLTGPDCELYSPPIMVGPVTIELEVVNRAPQAIDHQVSVREDGSIVITLEAFDPDGDPMSFATIGEPAHGCWEQGGEIDQRIVYRPHEGYVGTDSFGFVASDGESESEIATVSITVTPLVTGFEFVNGVLTVIGTAGNDTIRLGRTRRGYNVVTNFGTFNVPNRGSLAGAVVRGRDGNDTINVAALGPSQRAKIRGDAGDDRIIGGASHDILLGDAGNDTLTGGGGDDLLIGGAGSDRLVGSAGSDMLLGGIANDPCGDLDLQVVLDDWRAGTTADDRLAAAQPLIDVMLDDETRDLLTGGVGSDLFAWHRLDRMIDRIAADVAAHRQSV